MAKLIDPYLLLENPKGVEMYLEMKGRDKIHYCIGERYQESNHCLYLVDNPRLPFDMDQWNIRWRTWDKKPTKRDRDRKKWLPAEDKP